MAAEPPLPIEQTIQRICRPVGGPPPARPASSAPTSANGSANTECSNLIISSRRRIRLLVMLELGAGSQKRAKGGWRCVIHDSGSVIERNLGSSHNAPVRSLQLMSPASVPTRSGHLERLRRHPFSATECPCHS